MDAHACSGCSLCLPVCPVWRATRDVRLTPRGRAKALQHGASRAALAASAATCTLCGACEPACPEDLPLVEMVQGLRIAAPLPELREKTSGKAALLLAGRALGRDEARRRKTLALLGAGYALAADEGLDIAAALEGGAGITPGRLQQFLDALKGGSRLVVAEGILLRPLRRWLPGASVTSLGEALTRTALARKLRAGDLYVVEPRAYNGDQARLVGHYDALRARSGCEMSLDLQRIAIPLSGPDVPAQARWLLEGRRVERIVVEDLGDLAAFSFSPHPVLHLADL